MFTFLSADVGKTILYPTDDSPLQTVIKPTFVANFGFIRYIAGGFDGFLCCFNGLFEVDSGTQDLVRVGEKKTHCMLRSTILRQFDLE